MATSNEAELVEIEKRIKSVKERLGLQVPSDDDDDEELIQIKQELLASKKEPRSPNTFETEISQHSPESQTNESARINLNSVLEKNPKGNQHARIVFSLDQERSPKQSSRSGRLVFGPESDPNKRKSVSERLGKRLNEDSESSKRRKISLKDILREEEEILGHTQRKEPQEKRENRLVSRRISCSSCVITFCI